MTDKRIAILDKMNSITLDEMRGIRLMDRIDTKFVAPTALLPQLLEAMSDYFKVQINDNGVRLAPYTTQYFDTPDMDMFLMHQNGRRNRQKVRIRSYADAGISFLEIKNKNNKGRTSKIRVPVGASHVQSIGELEEHDSFLNDKSRFDHHLLVPSVENDFNRITLVNNRATERITIDIDLSFYNYHTDKRERLDNLMVLELKQDGWQRSDFRDILMRMRIKKQSFSKYCIGISLTDPLVKNNRFKKQWRLINKRINIYESDRI